MSPLAISYSQEHMRTRIHSGAHMLRHDRGERPRPAKSAVKAQLRAAQLAWIDGLQQQTGLTLTELARAADLDASTLTRFPRSEGTLNALTVSALASRWDYPASADVRGAPVEALPAEEAARYVSEGNQAIDAAVAALLAISPSASAWRLRTRGIQAAGYRQGDIVILDPDAKPHPGDAVCAQVLDFERMQTATVWRLFEQTGGISLLVHGSFAFGGSGALLVDGEKVRVIGTVTHTLRTR